MLSIRANNIKSLPLVPDLGGTRGDSYIFRLGRILLIHLLYNYFNYKNPPLFHIWGEQGGVLIMGGFLILLALI